MINEQRDIDKLRILMNAIDSLDEEQPDLIADVKDAAWNILHDHPGCSQEDWRTLLVYSYPTEIIDAFGVDPEHIDSQLYKIYEEEEYTDQATGIKKIFYQWAEIFSNPQTVEIYDLLVEEKINSKNLRRNQVNLKNCEQNREQNHLTS